MILFARKSDKATIFVKLEKGEDIWVTVPKQKKTFQLKENIK